jgi:hypothetical protein
MLPRLVGNLLDSCCSSLSLPHSGTIGMKHHTWLFSAILHSSLGVCSRSSNLRLLPFRMPCNFLPKGKKHGVLCKELQKEAFSPIVVRCGE